MTQTLESFGNEYCPTCGMWSDHLFHPGSAIRNASGRVLSVVLRCGWSGCGIEREMRL